MKLTEIVSAIKWNYSSRRPVLNWWDSPVLQRYVNELICGEQVDGNDGVATALRARFGDRRFGRAVSIGCGSSIKELALLKAGVVEDFDLFEISESQIALGTEKIAAEGFEGRARYVRHSPLGDSNASGRYDFIYWDHSLHHMADVYSVLRWCEHCLTSRGVVCINDYVGPTRLQWSRTEARAANEFLQSSAKKFGIPIPTISPGNPIGRLRVFLKDPSEAPQSDLIEKASREILTGFSLKPLGGALLNICGSTIMNLPHIPDELLEDFIASDRRCLERQIYHFAFGIWERSAPSM